MTDKQTLAVKLIYSNSIQRRTYCYNDDSYSERAQTVPAPGFYWYWGTKGNLNHTGGRKKSEPQMLSQGSVATRLRGGWIVHDRCIANFLEIVTVKVSPLQSPDHEKIFKIGQYLTKLCVEHLGFTFWPTLYITLTAMVKFSRSGPERHSTTCV